MRPASGARPRGTARSATDQSVLIRPVPMGCAMPVVRRLLSSSPSRARARLRRLTTVGVLATTASVVLAVAPALTPIAAAATNPAPSSGARPNATRLGFTVSGTASLSVDVATGNAEFTDQLVTLPGVNNDVPIALAWNSTAVGSSLPSAVTGGNGSGWVITGFDQRMIANSDGSVTYYGPGGLTGVYTPVSGGGYTSPPQFHSTLVAQSGGGWQLTMHASQEVLTFNAAGQLQTVADRNSNTTTFNYDGNGNPASIVSSRGSTATRTLTINYSGNHINTLTQTAGSLSRRVNLYYDYYGTNLIQVTDAAGGTTKFAYTGAQITTFTSPIGATTTVSYDASARATQVAQSNTATGSPGTSTTRFSYASASQTLVADPTTNQSQAVSAVPQTTYNLTTDGTMLVSSATDPDGHSQSATYNPQTLETLTQTSAAGGQSSYTYGSNSGESLTEADSPGGAKGTASYSNTGAAQYEPNSVTDSAGNQLSYTYNGIGNALTSAQGTGPSATVAYNSLGQPTSSQSPGAASGVQTSYSYDDTTHNLTGITPVSGTNLGARAYTWDDFGRLATATDGRGNTITYSYDNADRITAVSYSDAGTHNVTYSYDANGRITQRIDGSGTTTYSWDDLGKLLNTTNTAAGGGEKYTYDLSGALASKTDTGGTTSYAYTAGHRLLQLTYPQNGGYLNTEFGYDSAGRRSDVWLESNSTHSTWKAREHTTYDNSGRVTAVLGQEGPVTGPTTVVDQTACYNAGSPAPTCGTATAGDRDKIQVLVDNVSGETATFGYDNNASGQGQTGRLLTVTITGGSNPRTYTYAYDPAGNRTSASVTGTSPASQTLTFNNANQISTTGYGYDGAGNRTATPNGSATYNTAAQTTSATQNGTTSSYTYAGTNADELLTATNESGHNYTFVYGKTDQNGLPEIEQVLVAGNTNTGYLQHDPTTGTPLMLQTNTQVDCLYMTDITGNPILLSTSFNTTSYAMAYDPYGAATTTGGSNGGTLFNPYAFHFGLQDRTTGNVKFGARFYDPTTGTWTQQDTYNAPLSPGNANRYLYGGGDPINFVDETGRDTTCFSGPSYYCTSTNPADTNQETADSAVETASGLAGGCLAAMGATLPFAEFASAVATPAAGGFLLGASCLVGAAAGYAEGSEAFDNTAG